MGISEGTAGAVGAGRGAQEQATKAAAAVEEARRKLVAAERRQLAWEAGAEGERLTAKALAALPAGWVVLHDVHWPGRPLANLDHIAVGPGGVVIIDSKNWTGKVQVRDGTLRQNGYRRSDACEGAAAATAAVAALLEPQHRLRVIAALCLVGQPTPTAQPQQVHVVGVADLVPFLNNLPAHLAPLDVGRIAEYLRLTLSGARSPAQTTTASVLTTGGMTEPPARLRRPRATPAARGTGRPARPRPSNRSSAARRGGSTSPRRRKDFDTSLGAVFKLGLILLVVFVVLPRFLQGLAQAQFVTPTKAPTVSTTTNTPAQGRTAVP